MNAHIDLAAIEPQIASARRRARITIGLLLAGVVIRVVRGAELAYVLREKHRLWAGEISVTAFVAASDRFPALLLDSLPFSFLMLKVLLFATAFAFLMWLHRAWQNAALLGAPDLGASARFVVASFFIPVVNLFRPFQALRRLYLVSDPRDLATASPNVPGHRRGAPLVHIGLWWTAWLSAGLLDVITPTIARVFPDSPHPMPRDEASGVSVFTSASSDAETRLAIASLALWTVAAMLAALMVRGIDLRQRERARRILASAVVPAALGVAPADGLL